MEKRPRVIHLIYSYAIEGPGGGIGRFVMDLCRLMDAEQFEIQTFGLHPYNTIFEQENIKDLEAAGIQTFIAPSWNPSRPYHSFWKATNYLVKLLSEHPADIIHSHSEFTDIIALILKLRLRSPIILRTVHYGYRYEWRSKPLRRLLLTNFLYPLLFKREIGVSPSITQTLNQRWITKTLQQKALYIPNGININRFNNLKSNREKLTSEFELPDDAFIICSVGGLTEQKGFPYLLEAAKQVVQSIPRSIFLIIGEGEQESELRSRIQQMGLEKQVILTGPRKDIESILSSCDLFVSSSLWEGLPTVILESMAAGLPVVGTDIPGTTDLISHNWNGWLAPAMDGYALGETIQYAYQNHLRWSEIVRNANETISQYSLSHITKQYQVLYKSVLKKPEGNLD